MIGIGYSPPFAIAPLYNDGVTDNTAPLTTALTGIRSISGYFTDSDGHTYAPRGGGTIVIPPGVYSLNSMIHIKPRTQILAYGVTVIATSANAGFDVPAFQGGTFSADNVTIEGLTFDGQNIATHGIQYYATSFAHLKDVNVIRCASHGIRLTGAQWSQHDNVVSWGNGGYGEFIEPYDPGGGQTPSCNNNRHVNCFYQSNTLGGVKTDVAPSYANTFLGCTFQFSTTGVGAHVAAGAMQTQFLGCYWEANKTHLFVDSTGGVPNMTTLTAPLFWTGPTCERYIVNQGNNTVVIGLASDAFGPQAIKSGQPHLAAYEQSSTQGSMMFFQPYRIPAGNMWMFVDETGAALLDPSLARMANNNLQVIESDPRQVSTILNFVERKYRGSATSDVMISGRLAGEAFDRIQAFADGKLAWGAGTGAVDANISRTAVAQLSVSAQLRPLEDGTRDLGAGSAAWRTASFLSARNPQATQTLAANGAVTINPLLGDSAITLQANATSSTISAGASNGHVLTITWIQDATGGRTYVWPANCKFAGAAPADTTLNKRSSVTFRFDGTNWYEESRSVAVG